MLKHSDLSFPTWRQATGQVKYSGQFPGRFGAYRVLFLVESFLSFPVKAVSLSVLRFCHSSENHSAATTSKSSSYPNLSFRHLPLCSRFYNVASNTFRSETPTDSHFIDFSLVHAAIQRTDFSPPWPARNLRRNFWCSILDAKRVGNLLSLPACPNHPKRSLA